MHDSDLHPWDRASDRYDRLADENRVWAKNIDDAPLWQLELERLQAQEPLPAEPLDDSDEVLGLGSRLWCSMCDHRTPIGGGSLCASCWESSERLCSVCRAAPRRSAHRCDTCRKYFERTGRERSARLAGRQREFNATRRPYREGDGYLTSPTVRYPGVDSFMRSAMDASYPALRRIDPPPP